MKLNVKSKGGPVKSDKVTTCPECGSTSIEWKMTLDGLRHAYVCNDCDYTGEVVLETDARSG
ncbi:MAG: hypothetical protein JSW25_04650 [Thermoplasmata archaeon]|nr:MAG: hypothetical protein JSW25_04650 [Thermoplasmata archaeon]